MCDRVCVGVCVDEWLLNWEHVGACVGTCMCIVVAPYVDQQYSSCSEAQTVSKCIVVLDFLIHQVSPDSELSNY